MAGFIYIGSDDPGENSVCEAFGLTFPKGEAIEVKDAKVAKKLSGNPMFEAATPSKPSASTGSSLSGVSTSLTE